MPAQTVRCVLVKIHGIGNQRPNWSSEFDAQLGDRLATLPPAAQAQVVNESVWWADLSRLPGARARRGPAAPATPEGPAYALAYEEYVLYLAANEAAIAGKRDVDATLRRYPKKPTARLGGGLITAGDQARDVANYVSNNAVRLAILQRLSDKLFAVQAEYPDAAVILGSHSQGTIVAYDVLRLNGGQLSRVDTWVTMGCPLGWYLRFGRWGGDRLGVRPEIAWQNLFDPHDIVGRALVGLVTWDAPTPEDVDVDNVGHGLDAHDHWRNPAVVDRYFELIQAHLA